MNLNVDEWKEFYLGRLFDIRKGKRLTSADQEEGDNNYIGAIDSNNGVANHIGQSPIHEGNTISLSYNGSVGEAFYQYEPYWATDDVNALYCNYEGFNQYIGLFIATVIRKEKFKYSYGRKWTLENMNTSIIRLPIQHNSDGTPYIDSDCTYSEEGYVPDWQFMEDYIKSLHHKQLSTNNNSSNTMSLEIDEWKEFYIKNIFNRIDCTHYSSAPESEGNIPFISSTSLNNGVSTYSDISSAVGNCITISTNGDCFDCFYQPEQISVSTDVEVISNKHINSMNAIFICTVLTQEKKKWSYGRKPKNNKVLDTIIKLPIQHNSDGTPYIDPECKYSEEGYVPDWQFMEEYIRSLPYGDRL